MPDRETVLVEGIDRRALRVEEAARVYGVSARSIRSAMAAGKLTAHRVSVFCVLMVRDLDQWIETQPKFERNRT